MYHGTMVPRRHVTMLPWYQDSTFLGLQLDLTGPSGSRSSHSWLQVVSLVIPRFPSQFFVNKFRKNRKNRFFGFLGPKQNFEILMILYMSGISYINPYFLAPRPLKPLKSRPQGQNLPGFLLRAHSDHRGPVSAQFCGLSCLFLTLS